MNARQIVPTIAALGLLFSAGVAIPLLADTPTASIMGTIKDASGGVLADVVVSAKNIDTSVASIVQYSKLDASANAPAKYYTGAFVP